MSGSSSIFQEADLTGKTLFNRYKLKELLGRGGMGEVYLARDQLLERDVAVKIVIPPKGVGGRAFMEHLDTFVERFRREARGLAQIRHPSVVQVFDLVEIEGRPVIVMEYVQGETLDARLIKVERLPVTAAVKIVRAVLMALQAVHDSGIIHRDVKPSNVMLIESGIKLLDFGLAKLCEASGLGADDKDITAEGIGVGTVRFMAPEQLKQEPIDARTDIYAVGVMLYMLLTGKTPYDGSHGSIIMGHLQQQPPPMSEMTEGAIPDALEVIAAKAISKCPDDRYQTADEMDRALARFLREEHLAPPELPPEAPRPHMPIVHDDAVVELAPQLEPTAAVAVKAGDRVPRLKAGFGIVSALIIVGALVAFTVAMWPRQAPLGARPAASTVALAPDAAPAPEPDAAVAAADEEIVIENGPETVIDPLPTPTVAEGCKLMMESQYASAIEALEQRLNDESGKTEALRCLCRAYRRMTDTALIERGKVVCRAFVLAAPHHREAVIAKAWIDN